MGGKLRTPAGAGEGMGFMDWDANEQAGVGQNRERAGH